MKYGNVEKSADSGSAGVTPEQLEKINRFTRKALTAEEVYVIPIIACDNEVDRDYEKFTVNALRGLAEKYIGRTVICDHVPQLANQTARIFDTEVIEISSVKTKDGENLFQLKVWAYMLKNKATQPVIDNIDAGIYKEVSVRCNMAKSTCNICGNDYYSVKCQHFRGKEYDGKLCFCYLDEAKDAYELSFVAVPAQPNAGVVKWFEGDESLKNKTKERNGNYMDYNELKKQLAGMGIDLDGIAKTAGEVPPMADIFGAVKKAWDGHVSATIETAPDFLTAEHVKSACGKEMSADEVISALKAHSELEEKAKLYDEIKSKAIDDAVKNGIKAKGETFGEERYRKLFKDFSVDEINAQSAEWAEDAKKALKAGTRISEQQGDNTEAYHGTPNLHF